MHASPAAAAVKHCRHFCTEFCGIMHNGRSALSCSCFFLSFSSRPISINLKTHHVITLTHYCLIFPYYDSYHFSLLITSPSCSPTSSLRNSADPSLWHVLTWFSTTSFLWHKLAWNSTCIARVWKTRGLINPPALSKWNIFQQVEAPPLL